MVSKKKSTELAIEKLAHSNKWQTLYSRAKEISSIRLFKNVNNFTLIQRIFFSLLERYSQLILDIALGEEDTEESMLFDRLRVEAYFLWKSKYHNQPSSQTSGITIKGTPNTDDLKKYPKIIFEDKGK